jgi:exonuclease SbcD
VHKPQTIRSSPRVDYCGSLLQLDFGEREQEKFVNLVEVHPRLPAKVTQLPITAGRPLIDVGSTGHGVAINELAQYRRDDAYLRVFVDVDMPVANLAQLVRDQLPTAVHVERTRGSVDTPAARDEQGERLGPQDLFARFYASKLGRGHEPTAATLGLFRQLLDEESHAAAEA